MLSLWSQKTSRVKRKSCQKKYIRRISQARYFCKRGYLLGQMHLTGGTRLQRNTRGSLRLQEEEIHKVAGNNLCAINLEGMLSHGGDDILKKYLGGEGVAMVNYRLHIWTIPTVNFQTAAAFSQSAVPHTHKHKHTHTQKHTDKHNHYTMNFGHRLTYRHPSHICEQLHQCILSENGSGPSAINTTCI